MTEEPEDGKRVLTIKQELFAQKYVETGNASEAYRQAYDAENMSGESIRVEACRLLDRPNVTLMVESLRKNARVRHEVTVDSITEELEEARGIAISEKQTSAAVSASMGKAKLHGLITDKSDVTVRRKLSDMTDAELAAYATESERERGVLPSGTGGATEPGEPA